MLKSYVLSAFRSILKNRSFSVINVFGLSISMAVCMLIILVLQDQFSYDNFHRYRNRIFRVQSNDNRSKVALSRFASTTWPLADELTSNYVLLNENVRQNDLDSALVKIARQKYSENTRVNLSFSSTPLSSIVPGPLLANELGMFLPKPFVIFFAGLAIIIMLSAAFNYTSLSVARSLTRAKEYGIRKSFGASRGQLVSQILTEAVILSLISLFFAFIILQLLVPAFTGMQFMTLLKVDPHQNPASYLNYFIFAIATGLLGGLIPAIFVSSMNPVKVFKASSNIRGLKKISFRKILLIAQYTFSIIFIISIILLYRQMNFMLNSDLGFDKKVVYNIRLNGQQFSKIKDQFSQVPEVVSISAGSHIPGVGNYWGTGIKIRPEDESYDGAYFSVGHNYLSTMGIKIIAGEDFPKDPVINSNLVVINRKAVEYFKFKSLQDAVGQDILIYDTLPVKVIGVVDNYKYIALFLNIKPLILRMNPQQYQIAVLRINTQDREATLAKLKNVWTSIDPYHDLDGSFLEYEIKDFYRMFGDVLYTVGFATILAVVVACLGLYGMATYSIQTKAERDRCKEGIWFAIAKCCTSYWPYIHDYAGYCSSDCSAARIFIKYNMA